MYAEEYIFFRWQEALLLFLGNKFQILTSAFLIRTFTLFCTGFLLRRWTGGVLATWLAIVWLISLEIHQSAASDSSRQLTRLNYGVTFTPVRSVELVTELWSHMFDLHLPELPEVNVNFNLPFCDNVTLNIQQQKGKQICDSNRAFMLELHRQHMQMTEDIVNAIQHIYHLLPSQLNMTRPRSYKRALLPVGSYILKGLFGTATEDDLQPIVRHMKRIGQGLSTLGQGLQVQQDQLISFIEMTTDRMDIFRNVTVIQERAVKELYDELHLMINAEVGNHDRLLLALRRMHRYITHLQQINALSQSVELLLHGFLTPQLISKSTLRANLLQIRNYLTRFYPNFHLIFDKSYYYYTMHNFLFARHGKHLLINLQIPLTTFQSKFTVYRVDSFPVPVVGQDGHNTLITDLPAYFVTNNRLDFYFCMKNDQTAGHPNLLYITDNKIPFRSFQTASSCVSALFVNDVAGAHSLCSFTLQENSLLPTVHFLSNSRILLTNISSLLLTCGSQDRNLTGCLICTRLVPCNCLVKLFLQNSTLPNFFWPSKLSQCDFRADRSEIKHVVNMASLQSFFSADVLRSFSGDTYLNTSLQVTLPAFDHFRHKFHYLISADQQKSHNLHKFAKRVREHSKIYKEVSEVLLDQMSEFSHSSVDDWLVTPGWSQVTWWLSWSSIISAYVALCLTLYLLYKVRLITAALALVRPTVGIEFSTIFPKALSYGSGNTIPLPAILTNAPNNQTLFVVDNATVFDLVVVLLLFVLLVILVLFWMYLRYVKTNRLYLTVEIGNKDLSVRIRYLQLNSAVYMYHFQAAAAINDIKVTTFWPKLSVIWPDLQITHVLQDCTVQMPEQVVLMPWTAYKLSRILNSKFFYAVSLLEYNGNFKLLDFEDEPNLSTPAIFIGQSRGRQGVVHFEISLPSAQLHYYPSVHDLTQLRASV